MHADLAVKMARPIEEAIPRGSVKPGRGPNQLSLVTLDIDGTILGKSGQVDRQLVELMPTLREMKIQVALATGRPLFATKRIAAELGIPDDAPGVYFSGALVTNVPTAIQTSLGAKPAKDLMHILPPELTLQALDYANSNRLYVELHTISDYYVGGNNEYGPIHARYLLRAPTQVELRQLATSETILKMSFIVPDGNAAIALRKFLGSLPNSYYSESFGPNNPGLIFFNFTSAAGNREQGMKTLRRTVDVMPDNIAVFGDAEPDMFFGRFAGWQVLMSNADPALRSTAKLLAQSCDEGGVAKALKHMLGL